MNPVPVGPSRPEGISPQETPAIEGTFGSEAPLAPAATPEQTTTETQPVTPPAIPQNPETLPVTPTELPIGQPVSSVITPEQIIEAKPPADLSEASRLLDSVNNLQHQPEEDLKQNP